MQFTVGSWQLARSKNLRTLDPDPDRETSPQTTSPKQSCRWRTGTKFHFLFLMLFAINISYSQDSLRVSKNFLFKDGIYLSLESFQNNQPDYRWEEVESNLFANPQTFLATVDFIKVNNGDSLILEDIFSLSLSGIPYIYLEEAPSYKDLTTFVALRVRGKICYFTYADSKSVRFPMSAYNPLNGKPFRTAVIEREQDVVIEKMMLFATGEVTDFNKINLLDWIQDDAGLSKAVAELTPQETKEKLFKCLLIYDDRHEIFVPGKIGEQ